MCYLAFKTQAQEVLWPAQVTQLFEMDFHETSKGGEAPSDEDRKFIKIIKEGIHGCSNFCPEDESR